MMDRRSFLSAMLGIAVAPQEILTGLVTPAPVKEAIGKYIFWDGQKIDVEELSRNPEKFMKVEWSLAT